MAFTLDRLDHLVLTVASIDAAVDFYTEVLGMEMVVIEGSRNRVPHPWHVSLGRQV